VKKYTRRKAIKTTVSLVGYSVLGSSTSNSSIVSSIPQKAKSIIQIWLWGGPSHLDTFDPKSSAGADYNGPMPAPIKTNAGFEIGGLMPELAKCADKYSIIRSMTHGNNGHETASYLIQTGFEPGGRVVYPHIGAQLCRIAYANGYKSLISPYVVLTQLQGRFSEIGYLNSKYKPFATGGDPGQKRFMVEGIISESISEKRQLERKELLGQLDTLSSLCSNQADIAQAIKCQEEAYGLILGDGAKVFDLSKEKDDLRDRYGRNTFGQSCLTARKLVEAGSKFVTINYQGWDTHKQHFEIMRRKLPELDKGLAALITDLAEKGLLDSTIVWCGGEFGRSPKISYEPPWNGGRQHFGAVFSHLIAGGGFKGGQIVGSSDAIGENVKTRPVYPWDLINTMYQLCGVDIKSTIMHPQGFPVQIANITPTKTGGLLKEII
jgi:hypothetical protein